MCETCVLHVSYTCIACVLHMYYRCMNYLCNTPKHHTCITCVPPGCVPYMEYTCGTFGSVHALMTFTILNTPWKPCHWTMR